LVPALRKSAFEEQRFRAGLFNLFANLIAGFAAVAVALWLTRKLLGN
jgi:hypothetical protein